MNHIEKTFRGGGCYLVLVTLLRKETRHNNFTCPLGECNV